MGFTVSNIVRPSRVIASEKIESLVVAFTKVGTRQRVLPAQGIADVLNGILVQPITAKYPSIAQFRWLDSLGRVQGSELTLDFLTSQIYPPNDRCTGFDLYIKQGSEVDIEVMTSGYVFNSESYYLKSDVDALLALKSDKLTTYDRLDVNALLELKADASAVYSKAQVNALIPVTFRSFDYDQVATPTSPTNGQAWRERDSSNSIVDEWLYSSTNSAWLSLQLHQRGVVVNNEAVGGTFIYPGSVLYKNYSAKLQLLTSNVFVATTNNSGNYWGFQLQAFGGGPNYGISQVTQSLTPNAVLKYSLTLTDLVPFSSLSGFSVSVGRVGTPGVIYLQQTLFYRYQRP